MAISHVTCFDSGPSWLKVRFRRRGGNLDLSLTFPKLFQELLLQIYYFLQTQTLNAPASASTRRFTVNLPHRLHKMPGRIIERYEQVPVTEEDRE